MITCQAKKKFKMSRSLDFKKIFSNCCVQGHKMLEVFFVPNLELTSMFTHRWCGYDFFPNYFFDMFEIILASQGPTDSYHLEP